MLNIANQRLHNQYLAQTKLQTPAEVVSWMGAVQAQEYALAKWALGLRTATATDAIIEQAFNDGLILRTHVMRPTWHFVTPDDIRWILELTAPRVHQVNGTMYRQLELDNALLRRGSDIIVNALEDGKHLTRAELGVLLAEKGIDTSNGIRLGYIVHFAELEALICSGPRRGKQHTYALIAERAPQARSLDRDEALAELIRRYFTSHGPALVHDFAWWSGLTIADIKAGIELAKVDLAHEVIDGQTYWFSASMPPAEPLPLTGHLLPVYDEYIIAYKNHAAHLNPKYAELTDNRFFTCAFVFEGEIIALWRRTFSKKSVVIESAPFRPFTPAENDTFADAAQRFGDFLGVPVALV